MIGCLRRKWRAKLFRIGWGQGRAVWPRTTQFPRRLLEKSAVSSVLAVRGVSG